MNHAIKAAFVGPHTASLPSRAVSFFHSTPVLERKRSTQWNARFNNYARRVRKMEAKRTLLRNVSKYAESLFQSWRDDDDQNDFSSKKGNSWFRGQYWAKGTKNSGSSPYESQSGSYRNKRKGAFEFCCSDDDEVETIFRSAFGGERVFYWTFHRSEKFQWRNSSSHANHESSWNWRDQTDDEDDTSKISNIASERLALGLSASGPLKLEEVKSAYRACALRWHPDRHQGSSKVAAEEKFKHCSAAYKSLCDRLATV